MRTLIAALLLAATAPAQDKPVILVTTDSSGGSHFSYLEVDPASGIPATRKVDDLTFLVLGKTPEVPGPTDPPVPPGNARLRKLEADVRHVAVTASDPGTANAIGVVFAKVAQGVRVGTVSGATLQSSLTQALDLRLSGRPAWGGLKPIAVSALDNLRSEVGANPSPEAYALTIDAFVRGLGDAGAIRDMAATITPGVDESTLLMAMQATAPAIDWALWLPIILAILKLIFPGLGF